MKKKNEGIIWENISIRLRQEEKEALRKMAEEEDLPLPVYVKRLLRREIRKIQTEAEWPTFATPPHSDIGKTS